MFIDYYKILEIEINASPEEIRAAFRKQAIRWHPDKNPGNDTTIKMQVLNEAYLILKDPEARKLYDIEYIKFKKIKTKVEFKEDDESFNEEYVVSDDILRRWMDSAKKQSVDLAKNGTYGHVGDDAALSGLHGGRREGRSHPRRAGQYAGGGRMGRTPEPPPEPAAEGGPLPLPGGVGGYRFRPEEKPPEEPADAPGRLPVDRAPSGSDPHRPLRLG